LNSPIQEMTNSLFVGLMMPMIFLWALSLVQQY